MKRWRNLSPVQVLKLGAEYANMIDTIDIVSYKVI
jgi:hypothetical protein